MLGVEGRVGYLGLAPGGGGAILCATGGTEWVIAKVGG